MNYPCVTILGFALALGAQPLLAQATDDDVEAAAAALPAVMAKVPAGPSALVYNDQTADLSKKLGAKLGKSIAHEQSMLECQDQGTRRAKCSLKGGITLVNLGHVRAVGDQAKAFFLIEASSNSFRQPVESQLFVVDLVRSAGKWIVKGVRLAQIS